jgi:hypothetical protein
MQETDTLSAVVEAFDNTDGITAWETGGDVHGALVKVMDEDAVGEFFRISREYDVERSAATRNSPLDTVMDSYIDV